MVRLLMGFSEKSAVIWPLRAVVIATALMVLPSTITIAKEDIDQALMEAVRQGKLGQAKSFLNQGAHVDAKDSRGRTALMAASLNCHLEIANLLVDKGADVNAKDQHGYTALMMASNRGHAAIARMLIEKGARSGCKTSCYGKRAIS